MTECPKRVVTTEVALMSAAWAHYKAGFLPAPGGTQDQAMVYLLAMQHLTSCHAMHEKKEMDSRGR